VRFIYAGVRNASGAVQTIGGDLWINDIYLGNRRRDIDFAQRFSSTLNMGNIVTLTGSWSRTGPDFRGLRQRRGQGTDRRNLSLSMKTNVKHFVPLFGFNVTFWSNYRRNLSLPKLRPNDDVEIEDSALRDSLSTENTSRSFSATLTRQGSKNRFMRYTFDKAKINCSLSQSRSRSPSRADTTTGMNGTLDYSIKWGSKQRVRLFRNFSLRWWPNSATLRLNATRRKGRSWRTVGGKIVPDPPSFAATLTENGSMRYVPFQSLTSTYRLTVRRDVARGHKWFGIEVGTEINRNQVFQANYKPPPVKFIRALKPDINYRTGYSENSSPNIRRPGDPIGTLNASFNRNISVKASYDVGKYARQLLRRFNLLEKEEKKQSRKKGRQSNRPGQGRPPGQQQPPGQPPGQRPTPPQQGAPPTAAGQGVPPGQPAAGQQPGQAPAVADTAQTGTAVADTTGAEPVKKPDRLIAIKKLGGLVTNLRKINASYRQVRRNSYNRIDARPSIAYQLGLTNKSGANMLDDPANVDKPNRLQDENTITLDSGTKLTDNVDIAGRYSRTFAETEFRELSTGTTSLTKTTRVIWPDINVSWKGLEEYGIFKPLFLNTSATMAWRRQVRETGRGGNDVQTRDETRTLSPAIVFAWRNGITSNFSVQHSKNLSETQGAVNETTSLSVSADMKYSFDAGKRLRIPLPWLRNKVLRSKLDSSLSMGYTRTGGKRSTGSLSVFTPAPKTTALRASPRLTYTFTRALNGSFFVDFSRLYNEASDQTTTSVRVGIDAIFTF
jgi:cell surface protein SprA